MKKLAARYEIGKKCVLEIQLWDDQEELINELLVLLKYDKEISFKQFHSVGNTQLNTFIIFASAEESLAPYREMPVRKNCYVDE